MSTPKEILARVAATYASCRSYRDIGEAVIVHVRGPRPWHRSTSRSPFQTAFVRPHRFLFEFKDMTVGPSEEWPHHAVWQNGTGSFRWSTLDEAPGVETCSSVESELGAFAGISHRVSRRVPGLLGLFGGSADVDTLSGEGTELVGIERIDEREAWRLRAPFPEGVSSLWVDVERALILRSFEHRVFTPEWSQRMRELQLAHPGLSDEMRANLESVPPIEVAFTSQTTTFYRPEIDIEIPDSAFELSPPS